MLPTALRPTLEEALHQRHRRGRPVRIGLVGCGQMGTDILVQTSLMQGIAVVACCATRPENVAAAVATGGTAHRARVVDDAAQASQAIRRGDLAAVQGIEAMRAADIGVRSLQDWARRAAGEPERPGGAG